jgi:hypothetical protein
MNNDIGLKNRINTDLERREMENFDSKETSTTSPPPKIKSKTAAEVTTNADGKQTKNGIEIIDKISIEKEIFKLSHTEPKQKKPAKPKNIKVLIPKHLKQNTKI